jgi:hypothetical protein
MSHDAISRLGRRLRRRRDHRDGLRRVVRVERHPDALVGIGRVSGGGGGDDRMVIGRVEDLLQPDGKAGADRAEARTPAPGLEAAVGQLPGDGLLGGVDDVDLTEVGVIVWGTRIRLCGFDPSMLAACGRRR